MGEKNVVCNTVNNYHVAGIIDEAFNLTIWWNLCDSSIFKLVINNYIQYKQFIE